MLADLVIDVVFEVLLWPAAYLWPRLTGAAGGRGLIARIVICGCATFVIAGVYILAIGVVVGAVIFITGWL